MKRTLSSSVEQRWFGKMNQASSGVYRLAHAIRQNEAQPFKPETIFNQIEETMDKHLTAHIAAVSMLTARASKSPAKRAAK